MTDRTAQTVSSPIPAGAANISAPAQAGRSQPITLVVNIAGEELKRVILNAVSQELDT